jgi:hypothetical protein
MNQQQERKRKETQKIAEQVATNIEKVLMDKR